MLMAQDGGEMAMMISIILFGGVIGTQYRVASLIPCTLMVVLASAAIDRIQHVPLSSMILAALAAAVALQTGYVIGAGLRSVLRVAPASSGAETSDGLGRIG